MFGKLQFLRSANSVLVSIFELFFSACEPTNEEKEPNVILEVDGPRVIYYDIARELSALES